MPIRLIPQEPHVLEPDPPPARSEDIPFDPWSRCETWTPALFGVTETPVFEATRVGNQKGLATVVWLYRFYDAKKVLLYVGITIDPSYRWSEHTGQPWWRHVRFASIEGVPPKRRYVFESAAIRTEKPLFNQTQRAAPMSTVVLFDRGAEWIVERLHDLMPADAFAALVAAFHALPPIEEITS